MSALKKYPISDDFTQRDTWRIFRIMSEFVEGFEDLVDCSPAVSIFGSARCGKDDGVFGGVGPRSVASCSLQKDVDRFDIGESVTGNVAQGACW